MTTCPDNKIALDPQAAKMIAAKMRRKNDHAPISAYRCRHCEKWHVGEDHTPRRVDKKKKKR